MKKIISLISILILLVYGISCDEDCEYKPDDCNEEIPVDGDLYIKVTINNLNPAVPITVYYGDFENDDVVFQDTISSSEEVYIMYYDTYSVVAEYIEIIDGEETIVYSVDGGRLSYYSEDYCDGTCYDIGHLTLDATLIE